MSEYTYQSLKRKYPQYQSGSEDDSVTDSVATVHESEEESDMPPDDEENGQFFTAEKYSYLLNRINMAIGGEINLSHQDLMKDIESDIERYNNNADELSEGDETESECEEDPSTDDSDSEGIERDSLSDKETKPNETGSNGEDISDDPKERPLKYKSLKFLRDVIEAAISHTFDLSAAGFEYILNHISLDTTDYGDF